MISDESVNPIHAVVGNMLLLISAGLTTACTLESPIKNIALAVCELSVEKQEGQIAPYQVERLNNQLKELTATWGEMISTMASVTAQAEILLAGPTQQTRNIVITMMNEKGHDAQKLVPLSTINRQPIKRLAWHAQILNRIIDGTVRFAKKDAGIAASLALRLTSNEDRPVTAAEIGRISDHIHEIATHITYFTDLLQLDSVAPVAEIGLNKDDCEHDREPIAQAFSIVASLLESINASMREITRTFKETASCSIQVSSILSRTSGVDFILN